MKRSVITCLVSFFISPLFLFSQENNSIACSDGIDNDGDGLIDCLDGDCANLPNQGCATCWDGLSFADTLLAYQSGCPLSDPLPTGALGVSDYMGGTVDGPDFVFLGQGGYIKLGFTNNILINSGDSNEDLWVFEIGPGVESSDLALRPYDIYTLTQLQLLGIPDGNGDGFFEIGNISGSTSSFDIDGLMPGYPFGALRFDAIEVRDVIDDTCWGGTPGADIDAVCALSSLPVDCAGTPNGTAVIDACGECLEPADPNFNQSCADCAGTPNGTAVIDACGECLEPADPNFNQSCADCAGTPNGTAVIDACGECLEPADPNFNQSCADCAGVPNGTAVIDACGECQEPADPNFNQSCADCAGTPNGTAVIDACGECLEPADPNFNQSCAKDKQVYIPSVFSPNNDGRNDIFRAFAAPGAVKQILQCSIYDRWGELVYESSGFDLESSSAWWDGTFRGKALQAATFVYSIEVEYYDGETELFTGSVDLVK